MGRRRTAVNQKIRSGDKLCAFAHQKLHAVRRLIRRSGSSGRTFGKILL
jgi:hypothetical protein